MKFDLTYGKDRISLEAGDDFAAGPLIKPKTSAALPGAPSDCIRGSLRKPKGRPKLRELVKGRRVGLLVSDELRIGLQEQIIFCLMEEIAAGKPRETLVFIATGSHEPEIYARNITKWIQQAAEKLKVGCEIFPNYCRQARDHVFLGNTTSGTPVHIHKMWLSCEVRVHGHEAKYHYMNGYSCIDKHILPGLAANETIVANHKLALHHHDSVAGKNAWHKDTARQNNPFSQDTMQARKMSERFMWNPGTGRLTEAAIVTFGLDMVSQKDRILWIGSGEPDTVCRDAIAAVDEHLGFEVEKTKYLVMSPGAPPTCDTIYHVQNGFDMVVKGALLEGGEALVVAPCAGRPDVPANIRGICPDQESMALFWDTLVKFLDKPLADWNKYADRNFKLFMWKTDRVLKLFKESGIRIYLHSQLSDEALRKGGFIPEHDPQKWIAERAARHDGKIRFVDDANKLCVLGKRG